MCTAVNFHSRDHYFGRNLDLEYAYNESITITPRNYPFYFRAAPALSNHYAMIGMAYICDNYPLYYDATNEHGLSMAGLNFPGNAHYFPFHEEKENITPFELTPWLLGQCKNLSEAKKLLSNLNLLNAQFNADLPLSPLHWIISYKRESIVLESTIDGIKIYDNPVGVLTNNPPFPYHIYHLSNYLNLTSDEAESRISDSLKLPSYSRGGGAWGLPGDLTSASRFVRCAFVKLNILTKKNEDESISQFFHILSAVEQQEGCVKVGKQYEKTIYSSCCNTDKGIYYFKTYYNSQIRAVNMHGVNLDSVELFSYPLSDQQNILWLNE